MMSGLTQRDLHYSGILIRSRFLFIYRCQQVQLMVYRDPGTTALEASTIPLGYRGGDGTSSALV